MRFFFFILKMAQFQLGAIFFFKATFCVCSVFTHFFQFKGHIPLATIPLGYSHSLNCLVDL